MLAAQRARIAAVTAVALLALFVGQPLHGPAAGGEFHGATTSFASASGEAAPASHHAHSCPLCRAANQARVAITAAPQAIFAAVTFHHALAPATPDRIARRLDLGATGPRAPPASLSSLV